MISSILTVCTGNICRSPLAEYRLKELLVDKGILITSAGVNALVGQPADESAQLIAEENGFDLKTHIGQAITESFVRPNDFMAKYKPSVALPTPTANFLKL